MSDLSHKSVNLKDDIYWDIKKGPVTEEELKNFESQAIDYIYDMEPPQNNLFWCGNFTSGTGQGDPTFLRRNFYNAQYRIVGLNLNGPSIEFSDEPNYNHVSYPTSVKLNKDISITWLEDVYHSVQKYHMDWLTNWYDLGTDCFICGNNGKFRRCDLVLFHYIHKPGEIDNVQAEPIFLISLRGLVPKSTGEFKFAAGEPGDRNITFNYTCNYSSIFYNKNYILQTNDEESIKHASYSDTGLYYNPATVSSALWSPLTSLNPNNSVESHRLLHTLNSTLNSEGRLV